MDLTEADPGSMKRGGGGGPRESKFLDAAPENKKNRPKKLKSAEKGGPRPIRAPWIRHYLIQMDIHQYLNEFMHLSLSKVSYWHSKHAS